MMIFFFLPRAQRHGSKNTSTTTGVALDNYNKVVQMNIWLVLIQEYMLKRQRLKLTASKERVSIVTSRKKHVSIDRDSIQTGFPRNSKMKRRERARCERGARFHRDLQPPQTNVI